VFGAFENLTQIKNAELVFKSYIFDLS